VELEAAHKINANPVCYSTESFTMSLRVASGELWPIAIFHTTPTLLAQLFTFPNIVSRRVASSSCVALPNTTTHKLIPPSPPPVTHCSYSTAMAAVALSLPPLRAAACEGSSAPSFAVGQQQHQGYPATRLASSQFAERMIEKLQDMKAPLVSSTDDPKGCCALVDGTARM
jgi:hypothetical protein